MESLLENLTESKEPQFLIKPSGSKATVAAWCGLDEFIVTAHEDGTLNLWDTVSALIRHISIVTRRILMFLLAFRRRRDTFSLIGKKEVIRVLLPTFKCPLMVLISLLLRKINLQR